MRGRPDDPIAAYQMRRKHARHQHVCRFCDGVFLGNGGYSSHMRAEYFKRMPDMKDVKWITVKELRREWMRREMDGKVAE